ncbi:hypothetical protein QCA50_005050 [Cerrena zonata]|uniref:Sorbose reductase sou1 n=1 Tax=Cerrena zonata TaxID=2478898 RepID=A0AAW0GQ60_9APHY
MPFLNATRLQSCSRLGQPAQLRSRCFSSSVKRLSTESRSLIGRQPSYGPVGVEAARIWSPNDPAPKPTLFSHEFSLADRVALVSGANRGIGLDMALGLIEAGARAVYCIDVHKTPGDDWQKTRLYAEKMQCKAGEGRLEYLQGDVTDQARMWEIGETIGSREGRLDIGVAAAGILRDQFECLSFPAEKFQEVMSVNTNGVLYTAQAAGQQMEKFGNGGSLIFIASIGGHRADKGFNYVDYYASKSAVLQMGRSMACELGPKRIRVNTISPGYVYTTLAVNATSDRPEVLEEHVKSTPLNRVATPDELRGVVTWLASDASSFCTGSE